jgi:uncharacterized membrane protein YoaK (UPF0700 family)
VLLGSALGGTMTVQSREETKRLLERTLLFLCFLFMFVGSVLTAYVHKDYHLWVLIGFASITWIVAFFMHGVEWPWKIPKLLIIASCILAVMDTIGIPLTTTCT